MKYFIQVVCCILLLTGLFSSCAKRETYSIIVNGPVKLTGTVILFDQFGDTVTGNLPAIKVEDFYNSKTTYSDKTGQFLVDSLLVLGSTGYMLTLTDTTGIYGVAGYEISKEVKDSRLVAQMSMSQIPTFHLRSAFASDTIVQGIPYIRLQGELALADKHQRVLAAFVFYNDSVSSGF